MMSAPEKQRSTSFLKKRSKKLLPMRVGLATLGEAMDKVFLLLFFQKKKRFPPATASFGASNPKASAPA